ncbi:MULTISPECIES: helix-turn-helix domain-containing protein [unclassified Microbacterium]|uniref:helix-turn-helix domain-containing protein n=1 Tax=unclassified Microbacterium TaxID=2609290 RepID=UPI0012F832B0|nr:helix-turn-helix domain-containing protein [Microbacterium sp. MAH-37]MVQ44108.1 hypothetical protein [Microbacterium sp. MAH-37]
MTEIGDRIARLRADIGLTQHQTSPLSAETWSRIESGEVMPNLGEVLGIAAALGCFVSTVLGRGEALDRLQAVTNPGAEEGSATVGLEELRFYLEAKDRIREAGFI